LQKGSGKVKILRGLALLVLLGLFGAAAATPAGDGVLFQTSTIQALANGVYDGDFTFRDLRQHGDFGLGTLDALDGEMIGLDGNFYQIQADGKVRLVSDGEKTPFAEVVFFKAQKTLALTKPAECKQLEKTIAAALPSPNQPCAIKIVGQFSYVKARSIPRQHRPYPPLAVAAKQQAIFELRNVQGIIVGFSHPQYLAGLNVAGYHFHFITADRRAGGHLLDCRLEQGKAELEPLTGFTVRLPGQRQFLQTDLTGDQQKELEQAEK
jgi:acetolactate decarboxylase